MQAFQGFALVDESAAGPQQPDNQHLLSKAGAPG